MSIEVIRGYSSLAVDYSVIREFGGTALFSRMIDIISECGHEVYVSKAFKNTAAAGAMKDFCTILLASRKLHSVQATETADFISKISTVDNVCILTTEHSIFTKRLLEKKPSFSCDIAVIFANGIDW